MPGADRDDAALLRAHVDGDTDAFAELVRRHRDRLWAVALRTTGDPEEAADAVQEALLSAFRRAGSFRGDAQVTTWLHRIVVNACLDGMRRRRSKPTDPFPEEQDREKGLTEPGSDAGAQDVSDRRTDVLAALRQLSDEQRAALVLVDMEGYTVEEAADLLNCAPGTVKSRCSRGRARLAPLLTSYRRNQPSAGSVQSATVGGRAAPPPQASPPQEGTPL